MELELTPLLTLSIFLIRPQCSRTIGAHFHVDKTKGSLFPQFQTAVFLIPYCPFPPLPGSKYELHSADLQ